MNNLLKTSFFILLLYFWATTAQAQYQAIKLKGLSRHYTTACWQKMGSIGRYPWTVAPSLKVEITRTYILIGRSRYSIYGSAKMHAGPQFIFLCHDSAAHSCTISFTPHQRRDSLTFNMAMEKEYRSFKKFGNGQMTFPVDSGWRYFLVKKRK